MEPALPIDDSDDEACLYLKTVKNQSFDYESRVIRLGDSNPCEINLIPQTIVDIKFLLPLKQGQIESILRNFVSFKSEISQILQPIEKKYSKNEIRKLLYENKPLLSVIKNFDYLSLQKIVACLEEWIEDFEVFEDWIYCVLVLLEKPLSVDIYPALNVIMKKAMGLSPKPTALVIIVIISEFFGQKFN
ncbi:hypothetical protein SteCoe_24049 [Stentor coeruleus]|uniref:Uncharacterized protein n=1 Tax=Stentor coeruleus TaxID=5963 RepID=A0A1R2BIH8_9CILI|nr:hypothetical protein SteCoe_24049 [Stentor coeruleus]